MGKTQAIVLDCRETQRLVRTSVARLVTVLGYGQYEMEECHGHTTA